VHSRSAKNETWAALQTMTVCKSLTRAACTSLSVAVGATVTRLCPLDENTRIMMLMLQVAWGLCIYGFLCGDV
jgi:hypothetical protein